ncbi:transforming growth factor, beta receptor associated protein 1 [Gonapodya sp. JEL0774]|nr:transforming growth factor, beta receptor associated protein 1 [Gonapodya sp. JEL0774]
MRQRASTLCLADTSNYRLIDLPSGRQTTLFPFDRSLAPRPLIAVVGNDEFLIATNTALGVFLSGRGDATRGTLQWGAYPKSVACQFPFTLALLPNNTVQIHSIFTQKLVQIVPLNSSSDPRNFTSAFIDTPSLRSLQSFAPVELALYGGDWAHAVCMIKVEDQVESLFASGSAEAAVSLAEGTYERSRSAKLPYPENLHAVYRKAGCILFTDTLFEESLALFKKGMLDPAVLILIFPDLATFAAGSDFQLPEASLEILGWLGLIDEIVEQHLQKNYPDAESDIRKSFSAALVSNARETLVKYLTHCRENPPPASPHLDETRRIMIDSVLLEVFAETDEDSVLSLVESGVMCEEQVVVGILRGRNRWYALARYYQRIQKPEEAFKLLQSLACDELKDPAFPGLRYVVDTLSVEPDDAPLWKHASWILKRNPDLGIEIFTADTQRNRLLDTEKVLTYLSSFGRKVRRAYLEWLVNDRGDTDAQHHTDLAALHLDDITSTALTAERLKELDEVFTTSSLISRQSFTLFLSKREDLLSKARLAFITFLRSSQLYQPPILLAKMLQFGGFSAERAIVYSKMREHEKALKILAYELKDYVGAEEYCQSTVEDVVAQPDYPTNGNRSHEINCRRSNSARKTLYLTLLRLYLKSSDRDSLVGEVIRLLTCAGNGLGLHEVLPLVPEQWAFGVLQPFVLQAMRRHVHERTEGKIIYQLSKLENLKTTASLVNGMAALEPIVLSRTTACSVCGTRVMEPFFAHLPNGSLAHLHCSTDTSTPNGHV